MAAGLIKDITSSLAVALLAGVVCGSAYSERLTFGGVVADATDPQGLLGGIDLVGKSFSGSIAYGSDAVCGLWGGASEISDLLLSETFNSTSWPAGLPMGGS